MKTPSSAPDAALAGSVMPEKQPALASDSAPPPDEVPSDALVSPVNIRDCADVGSGIANGKYEGPAEPQLGNAVDVALER